MVRHYWSHWLGRSIRHFSSFAIDETVINLYLIYVLVITGVLLENRNGVLWSSQVVKCSHVVRQVMLVGQVLFSN